MELSEKKYDWLEWVSKSVFIKLKSSGDVYNATVLEIVKTEGNNNIKLLILDKFNCKVLIDVDDILKLKELDKEERNGKNQITS
jgi:hypothetical protein